MKQYYWFFFLSVSLSFSSLKAQIIDYYLIPDSDYQIQKKTLKKLDVKKVEVNVLRNTDSTQGIIETWNLDRGNLTGFSSIHAQYEFSYTQINGQKVVQTIEAKNVQKASFSYSENNKMSVRFQKYQAFKDDFDKGTLYEVSLNDFGRITQVNISEDQYDAPALPKISYNYIYDKKTNRLIQVEAKNLEDKTKKPYIGTYSYDGRGWLTQFKDVKKTITYTYQSNGLLKQKITDYGNKKRKVKRHYKYYL